jgi:hypothetical protein
MTTTKTRPAKKTDAGAELAALEAKAAKAKAEADRLARELFDATKQLHGHLDDRGLLAKRERLLVRSPEQYHGDDSPRREGSEAGKLQAAIDEVPDLGVLTQGVNHARRVEARAKEDVDAFIAAHYAELVVAQRPAAEAAAGVANGKAREFLDSLNQYLNTYRESVRLTVPIRGLDGRVVPGVDTASDLIRLLEGFELPAPVPEVEA